MNETTLSQEESAKVFPLYLSVDADLRIRSAGPGWATLGVPTGRLWECFERLRPVGLGDDLDALVQHQDSTLVLQRVDSVLRLRGQVIPKSTGALLLLSPALRSLEQLHQAGLGMRDIAPHDASAELLVLVQTLDASLADARSMTKRLAERRRRLVKARKEADEARRIAEVAQDQAERAAAARYAFLAAMSHEIRTPLNGVLGMGQLLSETALDGEQRQFLRSLQDSGSLLLHIINDILDFSKIDSGKLSLERRDVDLRALADEVLTLLAPKRQNREVELLVHVQPRVPAIASVDPTRLRQVLLNLLGNALKFTRCGFVELGLDYADGRLIGSIRDSGIGIAPEQLSELFTPFTQADLSVTRRFGGTGLGLSISQRLCNAMGGDIQVSSVLGEGSTFTFTLLAPSRKAYQRPALALSGPVAVVERRVRTRQAWAQLLTELGAEVVAVSQVDELPEREWGALLVHRAVPHIPEAFAGRTWITSDLAGLGKARRRARDYAGHLSYPCTPERLASVLASEEVAFVPAERGPCCDGVRVLLVEDNPVNQRVALTMLKRLGALPVLARDGAHAVGIAAEQAFDIILMDVQMPVMDGFTATERILHELGGTAPPIVAMTASVIPEDRRRAFEVGMHAVLHKPVQLESLQEAILAAVQESAAAVADGSTPA